MKSRSPDAVYSVLAVVTSFPSPNIFLLAKIDRIIMIIIISICQDLSKHSYELL